MYLLDGKIGSLEMVEGVLLEGQLGLCGLIILRLQITAGWGLEADLIQRAKHQLNSLDNSLGIELKMTPINSHTAPIAEM